MFVMGDEYGHTKGGNNNTYCHDAPLNWFDWAQAEADADGLMRFCSRLIHLRHATPAMRLRVHPSPAQIAWHGSHPHQPDWTEGSRYVAFTLTDAGCAVGRLRHPPPFPPGIVNPAAPLSALR